ncbi:globin [Psychromicrobium sp. YIM B11713]|uniref:globin n=1 Tax=Psychromicrobium sp. YIM B11713 TaxID=3145233 RepID=UPI00374E679A
MSEANDIPIPSRFGEPLARLTPVGGFEAPPENFYQQVGGHQAFEKLVHEFYLRVATDELIRPMYPEEDLAPAERRLLLFLEQYWGGPRTYLEERGHPRLRMRHAAFTITPEARDRWLTLMREALDTLQLPPLQDATLWDYLDRAAHSMVNSA